MSEQNDQPDLDLIAMVQQARIELDAQAQPSQVAAVYWIEARRQVSGAAPTPRAGFWLIHTPASSVDQQWAAVRDATQAGQLGYKSKVSTVARNHADERDIHVMTYDAGDLADVARVGAALRALGFPEITYLRTT